ncbi:sigma 54 modulation/S30EA ribosomal C-terminal domain-containing protein [Kitasatospora sp. NPDC006697]|uniref:sigma 54 modulation/S30EA ribosomal C-terminal domain-containing protein n=1 Tax=Kitasatospora sp. NPDC006697 TaxID=3364020 RepID=UPI00369EE144
MGEAISVRAGGGVPGEAVAELRGRIAAAAQGTNALVEAVRVRLVATAGTALAQVNAEVDGRRIRVQEAARSLGEAAERIAEGLRQRIGTVSAGWSPRPWPQSAPPVPAGAVRRIARTKTPSLVWCSPEAAVRTMDAMDYDIHLFTDPATETDAVVYRVGPTGYRLARTAVAAPPPASAVPLTLSPYAAPVLTQEQAVERLASAELPFLFFTEPGNGRGRVLYRRFDGELGLIAGV